AQGTRVAAETDYRQVRRTGIDRHRDLGDRVELRAVQRREADDRDARHAGLRSAAFDDVPPRAVRRAEDPRQRRRGTVGDAGILGRRAGAAAVHAVELPALRAGLRRRRETRHLELAGGRLRVDRELPRRARLAEGPDVGARGLGAAFTPRNTPGEGAAPD